MTEPILANRLLAIFADMVDDAERVRIANENRLRTLTDTSEYGFGFTAENPAVAELSMMVDHLVAGEKQAIKQLEKVMKAHPLWRWAEPIKGVGPKTFARLLASIRDPYWNDLHERPRKLRELRAYCGFHVLDVGVAPKRKRGEQGNWNSVARKRVWLIIESCIKQGNNPYRNVYDQYKKLQTDSVHPYPCAQCGTKGKPAQVGSPREPGHIHAMAMRKAAVEFLNDLWKESRQLHGSLS